MSHIICAFTYTVLLISLIPRLSVRICHMYLLDMYFVPSKYVLCLCGCVHATVCLWFLCECVDVYVYGVCVTVRMQLFVHFVYVNVSTCMFMVYV